MTNQGTEKNHPPGEKIGDRRMKSPDFCSKGKCTSMTKNIFFQKIK